MLKSRMACAFAIGSALTICACVASAGDHADRKNDIYNKFEVVHFCRTQTLTGALDTVLDTYCGDYANIAALAAKDIKCLAEVKAVFAKANPPVHPTDEPVYVGTIRWRHRDGIGPGEPSIQFYVAARKRKPSVNNTPISRIYFFNGGKYQRFRVGSDKVDKTAEIGHPGWAKLWTSGVDAALLHPKNGKAYFFKGGEYMRFARSGGDFHHEKTGKIGQTGWKSGAWTDGVDAALTHPNGKIYFFKGSKYRRLRFDDKTGDFVMDKEGTLGVDGWKGVWKEGADAAVVHANGRAYFFRGKEYKRFNFATEDVDKTGIIGEDGWMGVTPGVDAVLEWTDE